MTDPTIREQSYRYFLQEAPELLQVLEQELLSVRENYSVNKVNTLMRTTHTLKGAAASVGLETIKTVAHSLEDIFKALFNPDISIDPEVEALLFEGYECLRLPLTAELTGGKVNDAEILDRTAAIFAQLQEKLGDCFGQEAHIPSSIELGFDVTQSIFEVGVTQRLDELATVIASGNSEVIATTLQTQSEVFLGLAESLNLSGFGAIAQAVIAALDTHPEQAVTIAQIALADFQNGQAAVLNGDRTQGGEPSQTLQQLAGILSHSTEHVITSTEPAVHHDNEEEQGESFFLPPDDVPDFADQDLATESEFDWLTEDITAEHLDSDAQNEEAANSLVEAIWGTLGDQESTEAEELDNTEDIDLQPLSRYTNSPSPDELEFTVKTSSSQNFRTDSPPTPIPQKEQASVSRTVRVNVEHLEHLNYAIGELLTNQNRQALQNEQLHIAVRSLLARVQQHQQLLSQLQDWSDRQFNLQEQRRIEKKLQVSKLKGGRLNVKSPNLQSATPLDHFDSLELNRYSESQIVVQSVIDDAVQLAEAAEAIELFTRQSNQTVEKQRRLLSSARDSLMEARMLPLGDILRRFPRVLQQLEILHNKPVTLELRGTEVLVDKVVVEKLYEPLLHLVRNAFDHGIESAAIRQQWGKPTTGQIEINAYHRGRYLIIEVRDDGNGLDFEQIRQQAVEHQLISPERANSLNEAQLTDFLFQPGFSTVSVVNDLSGRGVGLDVVRAQLQALQGSVTVYTEPQRGTTFTLQIPLSLTIAKLLLCQADGRNHALLADAVEQILLPQSHELQCWEDGKVLRWGKGADERLIPIHQLSKVLDYFSHLPEPFISQPKKPFVPEGQVKPVILIRCQQGLVGLEVDQLLGEQELVIRPLGAMIAPPSYIYGGSVLADGRLTLVFDGAALMQRVFDQQSAGSRNLLPFGQPDNFALHPFAGSTRHVGSSQAQPQLPAQTFPALPGLPAPSLRARPHNVVLIVDDSITVRQTLLLTLEKAGYQVLQAKDGYEAIEQLQQQTDIQLVICDIEMPRMNGFEFLKHRQQDPILSDIPVVILTSRSASKHRLIAAELGATNYITKPYLEHQLLATVADVLEKNTQNSIDSVRG